jgi:hypothetical protein
MGKAMTGADEINDYDQLAEAFRIEQDLRIKLQKLVEQMLRVLDHGLDIQPHSPFHHEAKRILGKK